jgi:hypothetical protein
VIHSVFGSGYGSSASGITASVVVLTSGQELAVTLLVIISCLLLLTIGFELLKMYTLAACTKYTQ